ncbi:MAG: hypothetical protein ACOC4C_02005 [Fibrobacterota bacterium]
MTLLYRYAASVFLWSIAVSGMLDFSAAAAYDTLAGALPAVLSAENSPYIIVEDIEVPLGKTVHIEAGTVLLFKAFSGMHVQGRLVAEGTGNRPVVFTSELDQTYNQSSSKYANPYDWNGIYIHENALGSEMTHCHILYSVYGIISDTKFFKIESGVFRDNGKSNLVIEGDPREMDTQPFSYSLTVKDATVDGVPVRILKDPLTYRRNAVRYSSLVAILGGVAAGIVGALQYLEHQERFEELSEPPPSQAGIENTWKNDKEKWASTRDSRNQSVAISAAGLGLVILGGVGLYYSFTF